MEWRGGGWGGSNNAVTVTMGEIYLDEQEIFSESSEDEAAHVNQVVVEGDNLNVDASLFYSDKGARRPPQTPQAPADLLTCSCLNLTIEKRSYASYAS